MNFTLTETQTALRDLAVRIVGDHAGVDRVRAVERAAASGGDGIDRDLWQALADAGVLQAFADPADPGAERPDVVAAAQVCEAHGKHVAPVPLWPTLAALLVLRDAAGTGPAGATAEVLAAVGGGRDLITLAVAETGQTRPGQGSVTADPGGRLTGTKLAVPAAPVARWALVTVASPAPAVHLVDLTGPGTSVERVVTTDRGIAGHLQLDGAPSHRVGDAVAAERLLAVATVLVAATHVGACTEAVARTAEHLTTREQFGRPLARFQGTVLRIADAYVDTEAMRVTTLQAAWRLETRRPAAEAVATAKWWAAEAGHRVVHATQHLHGGIGADVDYPVHRYFLWGKQLGDTLGGAGAHAAELGDLLAARSQAVSGPAATWLPNTELPTLEIPVTRTLVVAGAIASRDFEPVHHDHTVAQERGSADLFMNILTSNGLIGRFVTDWTGPGARLRRVDIQLGVPAYPGDTLRLSGTVVAPADGDGDTSGASGAEGTRLVTVAVRATNARGDHAWGTVEVEVDRP